MDFTGQPARIFVEQKGCTIVHMGSNYPSHKISFECEGTGVTLSRLPQQKYCDVVISGKLNAKTDELTITKIE